MAQGQSRSSGKSGQGRSTGQSPSNITKYLQGMDFPAEKDDLIQHAKQQGANQDVIRVLNNIDDREYENTADVMKAYSQAEKRAA